MTDASSPSANLTYDSLPDIGGMEAKRDSEKFKQWMELALGASDAGVWEWDIRTDEVFWDKRTEQTFGYGPGSSPIPYEEFAEHLPDDDLDRLEENIQRTLNEDEHYQVTFRIRTNENELRWLEARGSVVYEDGEPRRMIGVQVDITEKKRTDRALDVIRRCREVIIRADDREQLLSNICQELVKTTGYEFAWVGRPLQEPDKVVEPIAVSDEDYDYLDDVEVRWDQRKRGQGPVCRTLRQEEPTVAPDISQDEKFDPWSNRAHENDFESCVCVPFDFGDDETAVIVLYASDPYAFADEVVRSLEQLADDVALRLDSLRTQKRLKETAISLEEKETLLEQIHHRVKNNMQMISSIINLHTHNTSDQSGAEILDQCQNRIQSMAKVHDMLYQSDNLTQVSFEEYVEELVHSVFRLGNVPEDSIDLSLDIDSSVSLSLSQAVPCGIILYELVSNACEHAFESDRENRLCIDLRERGGQLVLRVEDNGPGLPESLDLLDEDTVGLDIVKALGNYELGGNVKISSEETTTAELIFEPDENQI